MTKRQFRVPNVKPPKASAKFFLLSELKLYGMRNKIQRLPQLRNTLGSFGSFCLDDDHKNGATSFKRKRMGLTVTLLRCTRNILICMCPVMVFNFYLPIGTRDKTKGGNPLILIPLHF